MKRSRHFAEIRMTLEGDSSMRTDLIADRQGGPLFLLALWILAVLTLNSCTAARQTPSVNPFFDSSAEVHEQPGTGISVPSLPEPPQRCAGAQELSDAFVAERIGLSLQQLERLKTFRNLSNEQICGISSYKLARAMAKSKKEKRPDKPNEWARLRAMQQASDDGKVKPDGYVRASEQRTMVLSKGMLEAAGISRADWKFIGPGNIGGRIRSIVVHPGNPDTLWIGSVSGGIWKTTDAGLTWKPADDFMGNLAVSTMAIDPTDLQILYAGTGEGFLNADAIRGYGVFKSLDGGITWTHLKSTTPSPDNGNPSYNWYYVNRLAMSSTRVLLACTNGYYFYTGGVYRSVDGGATWSQVWSSSKVYQVLFDPKNADRALATTVMCSELNPDNSCKTWESTVIRSVDAGLTWNKVMTVSGIDGRIELAFAPSQPSTIYASFDHNPGSKDRDSGRIIKSLDGGDNWTYVSEPKHLENQGWYDNTIWVSPANPNLVVIGGIDLHRSTDGGITWQQISVWDQWPKSAHADHHAIVHHAKFDGTTNKTVFFGTDAGIFKTSDVTTVATITGWESLNRTLGITQFYGGAGSPKQDKIIGGTQDNGHLMWSKSTPESTDWNMTVSGDGGFVAIDPSENGFMYGEYTNLAIFRSTDGGKDYDYICKGILEGLAKDKTSVNCDGTSQALFIAPFVLDPNNPNTMIAGAASLWRSPNVKSPTPFWTRIKKPIVPQCNTEGEGCISAIAVAQGDSNIIWVGHQDGEVFCTKNGTKPAPSWTEVKTLTPKRYVHRIMIDKDSPAKVYVAFGGYDKDNLYRTSDGGTTWKNITANLPAAPIRTIVRHPTNANWLYVGTEVGIFASEDGGASWSTTNDGPANVSVDELFWYGTNRLVAATHGRSMFMATLPLDPCTYEITPAAHTHRDKRDLMGNIKVQTSSQDCTWSVVNDLPWVDIISGAPGTGNGTVKYKLDPLSNRSKREGAFTVAGKGFTVKQ
jgi:photosystem II stability/assembly factor-like uncharacterized protein